MPSKTDICNQALGHIGVSGRISDVDTENSKEAQDCRLFYDVCLSALLEMQAWAFCKRQLDLQDIGSPPPAWGFRYKYPNFCKRAIRIINPSMRVETPGFKIPFQVADGDTQTYGKCILTDQANAVLEYNHNITDPALFDGTFTMAFSFFLASRLCMPQRVDAKITTYVGQQFVFWAGQSAANSFSEGQEDVQAQSEYVVARG